MNVREDDIREITKAVWTSVLSLDVQRHDDAPLGAAVMTSCVQISGAWEGAVTLQCAPELAHEAAATMLDLQQGAASPDDVRDALGELANMVGGNIKGLLPGPTQLSLPLVVEGGKDALRILDTQPVSTVWFSSGGHPFVVTLLRRVKS